MVIFVVKLYDELESEKNLTEIFKELNKTNDSGVDIFITDEIVVRDNERIIRV